MDGTCPVIPKFSPLSLSLSPSLLPSEVLLQFGAKSFLGVVWRDGSDSESLVLAVDSLAGHRDLYSHSFAHCAVEF